MANGHGGHRTPSDPAPVSGPGALSQRTDGGPTSQPPMIAAGGAYGDRQDMEAIQGGAPMAAAPPLPGLMDPSARPGEPITAGADAGAGIGMQAAGIQSDDQLTNEQLRPLMRSLELMANMPSSNAETRSFVRQLKARMGSG